MARGGARGNTELTLLKVHRVDMTYYATLEFPAFELGGRWAEMQSAIYARLSRFNLGLGDIKVESSSASPGDVLIACWLLGYGAVVRYRLDRVEVWSNSARTVADTGLTLEMVQRAMEVVRIVAASSSVSAHSVNFDIHGSYQGAAAAAAQVATYVTKRPEGEPALEPSGVSFLCDFAGGNGRGSIVLERSAVVTEGAFLRVTSEQPGSVSEIDAVGKANRFLESSMARLGMRLDWSG